MILLLKRQCQLQQIQALVSRLEFMGFTTAIIEQGSHPAIAILSGLEGDVMTEHFIEFPEVEKVLPFTNKYKLVGRDVKNTKTVINIKGVEIGGKDLAIMAGPCAIESEQQIDSIAEAVKAKGANILRGGAFKPRTSPYDFQGLGESGLRFLQEAAQRHGLLCVSEVMDVNDVACAEKYVDILQIGSRNMHNFALLKAVGRSKRPVLLKRGLCATYHEFLLAAEYIMSEGNPNVIFCERGIRTFETYTRNTLDLAAVPVIQALSHLPIIVDPSHGTGIRHLVAPMATAAIALKADGLMVEVHTDPDKSLSDAKQTISPAMFGELMQTVNAIHAVCGSAQCAVE